jgi:uridylate kinase
MQSTTVISLGGSLIAPDKVDDRFLKAFYLMLRECLERKSGQRYILVTGGGAPCREYQRAFRAASESPGDIDWAENADWIGIAATRLNAELVRRVFGRYCPDAVATDPEGTIDFTGRVLVASGWKPGRSTDDVAVALAERFRADTVVNPTNIAQVFSDDPRKNPAAKPVADLSWKEYRAIVGGVWTPGKNAPFDPVAAERAERAGLRVIIALGRDLENLRKILDGEEFFGTTIHP